MIEKRRIQTGKLFWAMATFIALLILAVGIWIGTLIQNHTELLSFEEEKLEEIRNYIEDYYLYDTDTTSQYNGLYKGLIDSLNDPYAEYFTPDELELFLSPSDEAYVGIGAVLQEIPESQKVFITYVLPDGPAAASGIQVGDNLIAVSGTSIDQIPFDILSQSYIMGEDGTQVSLTVYRPSTNETLDFIITREKVSFPVTEHRMLENQTGYLSIFEFSDNLPTAFISSIEDLESQGMEQLIIDLRNNPGGSLDAAVNIADYLLPDYFVSDEGENLKSTIVSLKDKQGSIEQYECNDGHSVDLPIVILVNEYSASASELLSGALRDYGRAALVGMNTFGKGVSQTIITLNDGSAVKLTNMEYVTPSGYDLHGIGLLPDVVVENDATLFDQDNQLQAALQTLEEIRQGKRDIPILVKGKNELKTPTSFLEQAKQQPCKTKHLALTLQEVETLLSQISVNYGVETLWRTDSWIFDEDRGYERNITVDMSFEKDMWITFRFDSVSEELHRIELYMPTQNAIDSCLDVLASLDSSLSDVELNKLKESIATYPMDEDRMLQEVLKKKDYSVFSGYEEDSLSIIIE